MTNKNETQAAAADPAAGRDYTETLFLPKTDFPMRAGLPQREPEILARWQRNDLYRQLRKAGEGRKKFVLHDGPPYANGNIHIGHALNKVLKDMIVRAQTMLGHDANYVPGWDCHGLPIEWKIEEQYRAKGQDKDAVPVSEFRRECRAFAEHWIDVQREEFKRLGVTGDWENPYLTMALPAEAQIAREIMKFAATGQLYRGSKPVMWSVVERTALAEAEVEYHEHTSPSIFVAFPVTETDDADLSDARVVIWTTTPWTIPANRAIAYSKDIAYGLYEVTDAPEDNWVRTGAQLLVADKLAENLFKAARVEGYRKLRAADPARVRTAAHPLRGQGYDFGVPLVATDYVTDDAGTGFVHTAPGHGADDYNAFLANRALFAKNGTEELPHTVGPDGAYYPHVPLFAGARVLDDKGKEGDANEHVIAALRAADALIARARLKHQYPHSWRSKAPVIYRNTPQWFIAMDKPIAGGFIATDKPIAGGNGATLRERALTAITQTQWVPASGENRITGMISNRPDWVVSRQRAWGVPITVYVREDAAGNVAELAPGPDFAGSEELARRIADAFEAQGADAWFSADPRRFLDGLVDDPAAWTPVTDILDVWFDSGSTHAFTLEVRADLATKRVIDGGPDRIMYLEGSDQHRGWFHSSLLESCGTRGRAPYDVVLTHGFVLDERGEKMSKSKGNVTAPQDVIKTSGADILRLWIAASDYSDDLRIGPEIVKTFAETYRKLRNTLRWMLGSLHHFDGSRTVVYEALPDLEKLILHRLAELDEEVRKAYAAYDYKRVVAVLSAFLNTDLSAFYFDIRKDTLYCDPRSSKTRHAALTVIDQVFRTVTVWLAPILAFTAEEAWLSRFPSEEGSVHLETFPIIPPTWRNDRLRARWEKVRDVRRVVTGALELQRAAKTIGSSLEAAPHVFIADADLREALDGLNFADICITSAIVIETGDGPEDAFRLPEVPGVAVVFARAEGRKCARSWKILPEVGTDADYPDVTPRDAEALREWDATRGTAIAGAGMPISGTS